MSQKLVLFLLAIILIPFSTANVLIQPPNTEKDISGLETGFEIGFVNTGSEKVNLSLNSQNSTDLRLKHPQTVELSVSETTSTPEGSNWYYLGDGEYTKVNYVQVDAEIPLSTDTRRHNFDLSISRIYETSQERPNVEQVQEFNFKIFSTSEQINTGFQPEETNSDKENETKDNQNSSNEEDVETDQQNQGLENNETSSDLEENTSDSGFDGVTILLIAGIIVCAGWLFKEVF